MNEIKHQKHINEHGTKTFDENLLMQRVEQMIAKHEESIIEKM